MSPEVFDQSDDFEDTVFQGASLEPGTRVSGKQFDGCRFEHCSLQESAFLDCSFRDSSFDGCNLSMWNVTNTTFLDVVFRQSKLTGVDWTVARWSTVGAPVTFEDHCVLDLGVFLGLTLTRAAFRDCSAHDVDFSEADLSGCDFSGTDLHGARFNRTNLAKARLETAFSYTIDLGANTVKGARFTLPEAASLLRTLGVDIVDADGSPS
jgi:fluoroquinolone resistance protein